jgi:hypothetical protein
MMIMGYKKTEPTLNKKATKFSCFSCFSWTIFGMSFSGNRLSSLTLQRSILRVLCGDKFFRGFNDVFTVH